MFPHSIIFIITTIIELNVHVKMVSPADLFATTLACNDGRIFYNFSWNEDVNYDEPFDVIKENIVSSNCEGGWNSEQNSSFIILPREIQFLRHKCLITPQRWHNSTLRQLISHSNNSVHINITDIGHRLCNCSLNSLYLQDICSNGNTELIVKYKENSTTPFNGFTSRMIDLTTSRKYMLDGDYLPCSFKLLLRNVIPTFSHRYRIFFNFIDENKSYCHYENTIEFTYGELEHCEKCKPSYLKLTSMKVFSQEGNIYSVEYSNEDSRIFEISRVLVIDNNNTSLKSDLVTPYITSNFSGKFLVSISNVRRNQDYRVIVSYRDFFREECCYQEHINITKAAKEISPVSVYEVTKRDILLASFGMLLLGGLFVYYIKPIRTKLFKKMSIFMKPQDPGQLHLEFLSRGNRALQVTNTLYIPLEPTDASKSDPFEFPKENLVFEHLLDEGNFGKVYCAKAFGLSSKENHRIVAVKQLKDNFLLDDAKEFLEEISMLKMIGYHKNIVQMLACVTITQPYMMIMELILAGNLHKYLHRLRKIWSGSKDEDKDDGDNDGVYINPEISPGNTYTNLMRQAVTEKIVKMDPTIKQNPKAVLDNKELENFALQIAEGMTHLEKLGVVHRDLAARNILVTTNKTLKISDFGMSRIGTYVYQPKRAMPVRWMALEALQDFQVDIKSDVWSYGIVLWEIGTLGALPYEKVDNKFILLYLKSGKRLARPEICTDELFEIMLRCWSRNAQERPTFGELVDLLSNKNRIYVNFDKINSNYTFPPAHVRD